MGIGIFGVIWPDVEALVVQYLAAKLLERGIGDVWVSAQRLTSPSRQVVVRDDGGTPLSDYRATARIGVNVYAETEQETAALAAIVTALLNDWRGGDPVIECSANRAYPVEPLDRYLTAVLTIRGTRLTQRDKE